MSGDNIRRMTRSELETYAAGLERQINLAEEILDQDPPDEDSAGHWFAQYSKQVAKTAELQRKLAYRGCAGVCVRFDEALTKDHENLERNSILRAMAGAECNVQEAAKALGINRTTLLYRINKYNIHCVAVVGRE